VDPDHNSDMELKLTHGSFRVGVAGLDEQIVKAYTHWPSNKSTCSGTVTLSGTAPIVGAVGGWAGKGFW